MHARKVDDAVDEKSWVRRSMALLKEEEAECAETPLIEFELSQEPRIVLYLKDETRVATGSLKHRLARSLFFDAICNGRVGPNTVVVEASSGSTAISEAYFCEMLGLRFVAVLPRSTSPDKTRRIEEFGGKLDYVDDPTTVYARARELADSVNGYYIDQFTHAERVSSWTSESCLPAIILRQLDAIGAESPAWFVLGAGTGGTSATFGRHLRYANRDSQVCVVDPVGSVFSEAWRTGRRDLTSSGSRIEGIGRPRVEPSFVPEVIDRMITVSNADSISAMHQIAAMRGTPVGPSTGTNFAGVLLLAEEMKQAGTAGSIVTLICDDGDRYADTYYSNEWVDTNLGVAPVALAH